MRLSFAFSLASFLTSLATVAVADDPAPAPVLVTVAVLREQLWKDEVAKFRPDTAVLLKELKRLNLERKLTALSEVKCELKAEEKEGTFRTGKRMPLVVGWKPPGEPGLPPEPEDEEMATVGTEVAFKLGHVSVDGKSAEFALKVTHLYEDASSHAVNYGAAAVSDEERLKLSTPLPIVQELQWEGIACVKEGKPAIVASLLRHGQDASQTVTASSVRCLILLHPASAPAAKP